VGNLDVVDGQPGTIRVRGWGLDPDQLDPIDVLIYVNGDLVTSTRADVTRPDVGAAYRSYGTDHGFDVTFASTIGTKEVCVYAVNGGGGNNTLLGCATVRVSATAATGLIENAVAADGAIEVTGWAMVEGSSDTLDVDLYLNDVLAGTVAADQRRSDLTNTFGGAGTDHGFATVIAADPGTNTVCGTVTDPESGDTISLGCVSVAVEGSARPHGAVDKIKGKQGRIRVVGWALDPDGGDATAVIMIDGTEAARITADARRLDIAIVHAGAEDTGGFDIEVPVAPGDHNVCVYAYGSDGAEGPLLGCLDVTVE
jgi:hypothetical protein